MRYRTLGKTDLSVSVIGFGASALGNVFGEILPNEGMRAVHRALDAGINYFDVSPYYGLTLAESRLGYALRGHRHEVTLSTKCGRYGANEFDFSAATIAREFEHSLQRLQTDYVDLLMAHDIEFGNIRQIVEETVPALLELKRQGKARAIGLSAYWPDLLARVAAVTPVDALLNYCHCNLFADDMNRSLTPFAMRNGIGLINASPLHMGLVSGTAVAAWHPAPPEIRHVADNVVNLCREAGVNPAKLALSICLKYEGHASTLVSMSTPEQVATNLEALVFEPDPGLLQRVGECIAPVFNRSWSSGREENADTSATQVELLSPRVIAS